MKKITTKVIKSLIPLLLLVVNLPAQKQFLLQLKGLDKEEAFLEKKLKFEENLPDSLAVIKELKKVIRQLQDNAYIEASIDQLERRDSIYTAYLKVGDLYEWANLKNGNVEDAFLSKVGFRERLYQSKPFYYKDLVKLQESLLVYAENNGYPFVSVWLDSLQIGEGKITAALMMEKNQLVFFDKVNVIGDAKISQAYLQSYLGINEGDPFSKTQVLKIRNRIKELPFLNEKQNATITFAGEKATVNIFLEPRKASRFDFIFGFLPNSNVSTGPNPEIRRFQFTATFEADMHNQFALGERIYLKFEQLRPETQDLEIQFAYPYILNLPFGIDTKFNLYKRDTSYLDVISDLGIQYLLEGGNYLKAFWNRTSTNVLNVNEQLMLQSRRLPSSLDVSNSTFGLEYNLQKLDYRFNPRKGWSLLVRGGAGVKQIKKNNAILGLEDPEDLDFSFESLYDTLNLSTFQYKFSTQIEGYLPVLSNGVIKGGVRLGGIFAENAIYQNEQFRLGGNKIMRGYDEETIFATRYAVFTLEYRLLLGQNSYLYTFGDYGYIDNKTTAIDRIEHPLGFGAGITFETGVGIFGFSLALGQLSDKSFDFRNVKTHFGYISYF
ncbi:MAG: outer membrane translocation and assembly module TamA [Saprospiraceae bacterium]